MLRQEKLAFIRALSTLQTSPALLRELRMALLRRKKKPVMVAGSRSTESTGGATASQHSSQLAGKAQSQRPGKLGRDIRARQTPASAWRWVRASARECNGSHGRTSCCLHSATRATRGRGDKRGRFRRDRRPFSAKWVAQAHSHGFGPGRTRCLI
jgi:hypothetical protein